MLNRALRTLFFLGLSIMGLSACGGGGGDASEGDLIAGNFFPLEPGDRWSYQWGDPQTDFTRVVGPQQVDGEWGTLVRDPANVGTSTVYVVRDDGVYAYPQSEDPLTQQLSPLRILKFPVRQGETFVRYEKRFPAPDDLDGDGRPDILEVKSVGRVVGLEATAVPAGSFSSVLRVRSNTTQTIVLSSTGQRIRGRSENDSWFVDDIGIVRETERAWVNDTLVLSITRELHAYAVGSMRSDVVPPTVLETSPASGLYGSNSRPVVSVRFSEPMDPDSITDGLFTVRDQTGAIIPGTVALQQGTSALFAPDAPWVSGNVYTVTLNTTARDMFGNRLAAAVSWSFEVDVTSPVIVSVQPANGEREVPVFAPIVVRFDKPINPDRLGNILITAGGIPHPVTVAVEGSILTMTPQTPWPRPGDVYVFIYGVEDLAGNAVDPGVSLSFTPDQGAFAYFEHTLQDPNPNMSAAAIGDLNGDGVQDLVLTSRLSDLAAIPMQVWVRYGQRGQSPAPPVRFGPELPCIPQAMNVVTAPPGSPGSLVLSGDACGVRVLRSQAGGVSAQTGHADVNGIRAHRVADLNGDGRLEVLGVDDSSLHVWGLNDDGTLASRGTLSLGLPRPPKAFDVGDLNGDGRLDLAVALGLGGGEQNVAVISQGTDGAFEAPVYFSAGGIWGATDIAVGDVNGDGRDDIAALPWISVDAHVAIFLQTAQGQMNPPRLLATANGPQSIRLADLNGDGRQDIVVGHDALPMKFVGVYTQGDDGVLGPQNLFVSLRGTHALNVLDVGDVTGDGRPDIVHGLSWLRQKTPANEAGLMMAPMLRGVREMLQAAPLGTVSR